MLPSNGCYVYLGVVVMEVRIYFMISYFARWGIKLKAHGFESKGANKEFGYEMR